MICLVIYHKIK